MNSLYHNIFKQVFNELSDAFLDSRFELINSQKVERKFYQAIEKWLRNDDGDLEKIKQLQQVVANCYWALSSNVQDGEERTSYRQAVEQLFRSSVKMTAVKDVHYSRGDRYSVFQKAATIQRTSIQAALIGMMCKHIVSLIDLLEDCEQETKSLDRAVITEKCTDLMCYLFLLGPIVKQQQ